MPGQAKVSDVLEFLQTPKSGKEIREKFGLSNSENYHFIRWLLKAKEIVKYGKKINFAGKTARHQLYITNKDNKNEN